MFCGSDKFRKQINLIYHLTAKCNKHSLYWAEKSSVPGNIEMTT